MNSSVKAVISAVCLFSVCPLLAQPVITSPATASGAVGASFACTISATGSPTSFSAEGLPWGLTLDTSRGAISGIPAAAGTFLVTLGATGTNGTGTAELTLTIAQGIGLAETACEIGEGGGVHALSVIASDD